MKHAIQNGPYCSWLYHQRGRNPGSRSTMLGDILSAGHAAKPATQGFVFQLYQSGVIDNLNNLLFCAAAVPIATSADVLKYQIPKVHLFLTDTGVSYTKVVTLTVGGNDAFLVLKPDGSIDLAAIPGVLTNNLLAILSAQRASLQAETNTQLQYCNSAGLAV